MAHAHTYLTRALMVLFTITCWHCYAMSDEYRRQALETSAHDRLFAKMNAIIANTYKNLPSLTEDEKFILLKRLNERIHEQDLPPLSLKKFTFFALLKYLVKPSIRQRALPLLQIPPRIPPRPISPELPPRDDQQGAGPSSQSQNPEEFTGTYAPAPIQSPQPMVQAVDLQAVDLEEVVIETNATPDSSGCSLPVTESITEKLE